MKKRFWSTALAVLMIVNLLPISVLAEDLADTLLPVHNTEIAATTAEAPNSEEVCPHSQQAKYVLTECICNDGCSAKKGVGELYFCRDCGELIHDGSWNGGAYSAEDARLDPASQTVTVNCGSCHAEKTFPLNEEHTHSWDEGTVIEPTCTEQGYTKYACACGAERVDHYMPALGHKWNDGVVTVEPNCAREGEKVYTCKVCSDTKTETLGLNDMHQFAEETTPATCETDGSVKYTCTLCQYSYTKAIPHGHHWEETSRTDATCVAQGSVTYTCSVCKHTKTDILEATGKHIWVEKENTATCEKDGYITYQCRDCLAIKTTDTVALGHDWGDWVVVTEATCTAPGTEKRVCTRGCEETRDLPIISHEYDEDYQCSYCHKTYPEVQAIVDAIAALPAANRINEGNALAVFNNVQDISSHIESIENGTDANLKAALKKYADTDKLSTVEQECLAYLIFTEYKNLPGEQRFEVFWNDNSKSEKRTPMDQFIAASHAQLGYEIVSEDGKTVVASGTLLNAADANEAFSRLGLNLPEDTKLFTIESNAASYLIKTNSQLPVGYESVYTDYTTGESTTSKFKINYTLTLENPVQSDYVTTLPERTQDPVTLKNGEKAIFTILADWSASIVWYDDNNRSALGGTSTQHTPRVSADDLKAASTVYYYPQGYNSRDAKQVEGDFGYEIVNDTIRLTNLPAYDNEGSPLAYYISQDDIKAANADFVPGNRYTTKYQNVGNFASKDNGVYNGGYLLETLYNTVPFRVSKAWADGETPETRARTCKDCKFYIWRITENYNGDQLAIDPEFCYAIPNCYDSYDVPKDDISTYEFVRDMGAGQYLRLFPMYDTEGRRYIYFGKERGLPGEYSSVLDNTDADAPACVISAFSEGANSGYFLNGASITNTKGERLSMPVSKEFSALSLQNKLTADSPITATFLLQKKNADGSWVNADIEDDNIVYADKNGVTIDRGSDNSLTVTLSNFAAEAMEDSYSDVTVSQYDKDYNVQEYRWVETGVSVNGVSASYQPSDWVSDGDGMMHYEGDIVVNDGQTSTVLGDDTTQTSGPDDTTAIFSAVASGSHFTNKLIGKHQVEIRKYFYDENGKSIAADAEKMAGVEVTFTIYRDDEPINTVTMTYDDLSTGNDHWVKLLNYDRYDDEGREYHFKVKETDATGQWARSENYEVQVLEYPADSDILVKRLQTVYVNAPGPGNILEFDVEKKWLDDSDLQTRNPVVAAVYRFCDADGNLLDTPVQVSDDITLFLNNNWYKKVSIPAVDGTRKDSTENYVILEKGILVDDKLVETNYSFDFTSQALADIHDAITSGQAYAGITGSTEREDKNWDGLCYRYKLFEERADRAETPALASYVLTNLRIGTQDYVVEKTWKAGGQIRKCSFGLFYENTMIAEFTLDVVDDMAKLDEVDWKIPQPEGVEISASTPASRNADNNYEASVKISGLAKFDNVGAQQEYSIQEIAIYGKDNQRYPVSNGGCKAGDETYAVSVNTSLERADNDNHRSPDLYTVKVTNTLVGKYDLVSNKVWRDANQVARPDVCFSIYRMSTKDTTLREYVDSRDTAAMSAYLAKHTDNDHRVSTDRYWDTHINSYWWTCTVKDMQQYDSEGYPYVYFATEQISNTHVGEGDADGMSTSALYQGYYCNYTADQSGYRPTNPAVAEGSVLTTQQVFGVENDKLCGIDGNVFILADGIHKTGGEYKDYYSATAVNRPERERTVSGEKLWKLPQGWAVPSSEMPQVEIDLYRTTAEISYSQFDTSAEYVAAIKAAADDEVLNTAIASDSINNYAYTFETDKNNAKLPRFNEWGSTYYYYTLENPNTVGGIERQNFPASAVVYEDNDFNINNIFSSQPPYVEVKVVKSWQLSADVMDHLSQYGLSDMTTKSFAPAKIKLYGIPTDSQQQEIENSSFDFGSVTLTPGVTDSDGDQKDDTEFVIDETHKVLKATYTFKTFLNDETGEKERLPYYWLHNYKINYYLDEVSVNGYEETYNNNPVTFDNSYQDGDFVVHYNGAGFQMLNLYTGVEKKTDFTFTFSKVWNDKYVANDAYRPDQVTFTIKRSVDGEVDSNFERDITLHKSGFPGKDTWSGNVSGLLKFAPSGKEYVYFVDSEKIVNADGEQIADVNGEEVGNYVLTDKGNNRLVNTLNDQLRVTVEASKSWTVDGKPVDSYTNSSNTGFDDLRKMGVFPESVQFAVQRSVNGGEYDYVPASEYQDTVHKITVDGQAVVGREVDLAGANENNYAMMLSPSMKWDNLPKKDTSGQDYTYRVVEILNWQDGTHDTVLTSGELSSRAMSAAIEADATGNVFTLTNNLETETVRIAKVWDDGNGSENTRPAQITVEFKPVGEADGKTFILKTTGNDTTQADANIYYSEYFQIPRGIAMTYGVVGAKYSIEERIQAPNGAIYTQTVTSGEDGVNVVELGDGTWALKLTNTYEAKRKTVDLEATKKWSGDDAWKAVTRPEISFKIQYYNRDTKAWTDITNMSQFSSNPTQSAVQTVLAENGNKVTWTDMYKYWQSISVDGKAELIKYRVVEVMNTDSGNASYSKNSPEFKNISDSTTVAKATLTNTLQTTTVKVSKSWTKNKSASDKLTNDEVKKLVALNAIPNELTFAIEYRLSGSSEWNTVPNGTVTYTAEQLLSTKDTGKTLPQYDKNGNEIAYRVRETAVKYKNGNSYAIGNSGIVGSISTAPQSITFASPTAAMVNDYQYVALEMTKVWQDEGDRDGLRKDISVTLQRDGKSYSVVNTKANDASQANGFCTVTKNGDSWAMSWNYLPMYQEGKEPTDANQSVYTWSETTGAAGYDVTYDKDGAERSKVDNTYQPMRGTVVAAKNWSDNSEKFNSRPDEIYLKLQYKVGSGTWQDVTTNTLVEINGKQFYESDTANVATVAYTTSTAGWRTATATDNWSLSWADLPVKALSGSTSVPVTYRVVEGIKGADGNIAEIANNGKLNGYTVTYSEVSLSMNGGEVTSTVTNTMDTTTLNVSKSWTGDSAYMSAVRPESVTFNVEWKKSTDSNWSTIPDGVSNKLTCDDGVSTVTVTADGRWNETITNLPQIDADGTAYQYRIAEAKITYANGDVAVNSDKSMAGPYDVEDVTVEAVYSDGKYTATADNSLLTGKLSVTKVWVDENDRDGGRQPITAELYRDGVKFDEKTISAADNWTAEFTNLPVYKNTASSELTADKSLNDVKSVYTVKEAGEDNGAYTGRNDVPYAVSYSDGVMLAQSAGETDYAAEATITNTHDVFKGSLTVSKVWDDADNRFDSRPADITLTLQYQSGEDWVDVAKVNPDSSASDVYTDSDNPGKISNTGSYTWTGLPVKLDDQTLTYRVVESDVDGYRTAVYTPATVQLVKTNHAYTANVAVTNTLDTTSLTIHKDWESVSYLTPVSAEFLVEFSHGSSGWQSYGNVTVNYTADNASGETTINGLPKTDGKGNAYTYRVSEASVTYYVPGTGNVTVNATGTFDDSNAWSGNVGIYAATVSGITNDATMTFTADNKVVKGDLSVTKTWVDDNNRDGGRQAITVELYRDGVKFAEKTISAADDWAVSFTDLPVYQNTATGTAPAKSVYTLQEKGLNDAGEYVGKNDRIYTVSIVDDVSLSESDDGSYHADASVTNTHDSLYFSVKAVKAWEDAKDYGIRPDVQLELRWATSADATDWEQVTQSDTAPVGGDGMTVTTTSDPIQALKNKDQDTGSTWGSVQWDNLPAYVVTEIDGVETSVPVYYKAFEVGEIPASYVSTESTATSYAMAQGDDKLASVQVVNTLEGKMAVTAQKIWQDNGELYNAHADSITVKLQYATSASDTEWKDVPVDGTQVLSANSVTPWSYTWENLRNDYSYRVIEVCMAFGETVLETIPAGGTDGEIGGYAYSAKATVNENGTMTQCDITNELIVGKIVVSKTWNDAHDRDGMRPEILNFELYRDDSTDPIAERRAAVTADGIEQCVFENLPVYKEGTRELSHYYVVETDEDGYSISYDVTADNAVSLCDEVSDVTAVNDRTVSVTNAHETQLFRVEAAKAWDDASDPYGMRPAEVSLKLQYAFSPDSEEWTDVTAVTEVPDPAEEDGTVVFTTSELIQTLTGKDQMKDNADVWGTAAWENLPAYALMQVTDGEEVSYRSMPVYYRVVESEAVAESYSTAATDSMCYEDAAGDDMTAVGTVTNTLKGRTALTVTKTWVGDKPDTTVVAQLQYRENAASQWKVVPQNAEAKLSSSNNWTATFTDLRADYEYRCVELGMMNRGKLVEVSAMQDKNGVVSGTVLSYSSLSETRTAVDETGSTVYTSELTNTYVPEDGPGTGDTYNSLLYGAGAVVSAAGVVGLIVMRKKKEEA